MSANHIRFQYAYLIMFENRRSYNFERRERGEYAMKKEMYFVRHGNTTKDPIDANRVLTDLGREQAMNAGFKLKGITFGAVFCSSAQRTVQTATNMLGDELDIVQVPELFELPDAEGRAVCNAMFKQLGYASLRDYYKHGDAETLHRFGQVAGAAIKSDAPNTLVVAHAVLINCLVHEMFTDEQVRNLMLDTNLKECDIVRVQIDDDGHATAQVL